MAQRKLGAQTPDEVYLGNSPAPEELLKPWAPPEPEPEPEPELSWQQKRQLEIEAEIAEAKVLSERGVFARIFGGCGCGVRKGKRNQVYAVGEGETGKDGDDAESVSSVDSLPEVGDPIEIWSVSANRWVDGQVDEVLTEETVVAVYGDSGKEIDLTDRSGTVWRWPDDAEQLQEEHGTHFPSDLPNLTVRLP